MHSVLLQQMLLALVLTLSNPFANSPTEFITALPITSKPIESTVENLAWQAWIMLPPQQQNLEKSRKVTPKSIFILPNRVKVPPAPTNTNGFAADGSQFLTGEVGSGYAPLDCPPGQRQFESRCIPTVDIDREQLLIQELQILLQHGGGGAASNQAALEYDYDYDDDNKPMVGNFEPPLMLNGGEPPILIGNNYDDSDRLPVEDAPLKFNIFREKFPTDGASAAENSNEKSAVFDPMAVVENGTVPEGWKAVNITQLWTDLAIKMQMENGDEAAGSFFPADLNQSSETIKADVSHSSITTTTAASATISKVNSSQSFALSDIDAIMLPAATTTLQSHQEHHHHHHRHEQQQHQNSQQQFPNNQQQFAIFKDDSAMQLFAVEQEHEDDQRSSTAQQQKTTEIMELLKVDALLPLNKIATGTTVTRSTVTPLPFLGMNAVHKDTLDAVTEATTTTTFPTPLAEILEEVKDHASQEREKEERTRSVTLHMLDDDLTTTNEIESDPLGTTTTEAGDPPSTTIIDELSIDAIPNNNDAALLQLDEAISEDPIEEGMVAVTEEEDPARRLNDFSAVHEVRKKSKVEPVAVELLNAADEVDYDEQTTPLPTPPEFEMLIPEEVDSFNALTNVAAADADFNRFTEKNTATVVGAAALNNEVASVESKTVTTTTTTTAVNTATTKNSEIDIATELRIINELVKGKRQGTASTSTATTAMKATSTESTIATPTILATTTTTAKSNTAPIKNNSDLKQETTATSVKTLLTTIKNDVETTTTSWILNAKSGTTPSHKSSVESGNIVTMDPKAELNSKSNSAPTTNTTTTESTATLWSKILPFLSFGSTTTKTTPVPADVALSSADGSAENSSSLRSSSTMNRRNSKIIRINNLSTNGLSEVESSKIATTPTTTTTVAAVSLTTTTELPFSETTTTIASEDTSSSSFWWLPIGWSSESTDAQHAVIPFRTHKNAVTPVASAAEPQSLLLRFWNAFPGNQKRS